MTVFGMSDRGKFYSTSVDTADGHGIQIRMPGGNPIVGNASLVTSFDVAQRENFAISQCLNGGVYLYTFGHDPQNSQYDIGITSFLNTCDGEHAADLAQAFRAYYSGRVSQSKDIASMSIGDAVLRGYLVGQNIRVADNALGMVASTYSFIALNPHAGGAR